MTHDCLLLLTIHDISPTKSRLLSILWKNQFSTARSDMEALAKFEKSIILILSFRLKLTLSVWPGSLESSDLSSRWIPVPGVKSALNECTPCTEFASVEDSIIVRVETGQDDTSINGGETSNSVFVLIIAENWFRLHAKLTWTDNETHLKVQTNLNNSKITMTGSFIRPQWSKTLNYELYLLC